jgi:hypothetical protein
MGPREELPAIYVGEAEKQRNRQQYKSVKLRMIAQHVRAALLSAMNTYRQLCKSAQKTVRRPRLRHPPHPLFH